MNYSVTFMGSGNASRNTWDDWRLKPESPPVVPLPKPKTNYVEIPGRSRGPLDLTNIPFNRTTFERITGSWQFVMDDNYWYTPNVDSVFGDIRAFLHGGVVSFKLETDPTHKFYGRFTVDPPKRGAGPIVVVFNFDLEPIRYNTNGAIDVGWLPAVETWTDPENPILDNIFPIPDLDIHDLFT